MGQYFLPESGDKPEKEVDVEMGGRGVLLFTTLQFRSVTFTLCGGKYGIPLLLFGSSVF